jgi:DNA-binding response OmpR family regulator
MGLIVTPPGCGSATSVLLVDDNLHCRRVAERLLRSLGFEVLVAHDPGGAERLLAAHGDQIGLVMLDLFLGPALGSDLASRLDRDRPALPVLMMSGATREICDGLDVLGQHRRFIEKPFSLATLSAALDALLVGPAAPSEAVRARAE